MLDVALTLLLLSAASAAAATRYVWQGSPSPAPPYTTWTTAAHVLQDAVDAAQTGDTVLVAGGVYATGGRAVSGSLANRVAIDRAITVESLMGPEVTIIQGYQMPGTTNGDGAIRCAYLTNGASLSGFTLTNGATRSEGNGDREQSGGGVWCESATAVVSKCWVVGNSAFNLGGGAYGGTLNHCTLSGNLAWWGAGAGSGTLNDCTLMGNSASAGGGGGACYCSLNNCSLTGNSADYGGGARDAELNNCILTGNLGIRGGGVSRSTLNNCTLTGNSAFEGGGAYGDYSWDCILNNCIVLFNTGAVEANYSGCTMNYCCTTPLPATGTGNTTDDPQLASASHLSAASPCRGAGSADYVSGTDIDGESWASPPSIGCDEYHAGAVSGPLSVDIVVTLTNVAAGFPVELTASITGRTSASVWEFGDGVAVSNRPYASHAWATPGGYAVVLRAYNESHPTGVAATVAIHVVAPPVHYVAVNSTNPEPPYTSWGTAATNIQDAVDAFDAETVPGAWVLVSNGVYATGGRAVRGSTTNRVAVTRPLLVRSVNGPQFTVIQGWQVPDTTIGDGAIRCAYLTNGASLSGFTLTHGATQINGSWTQHECGGGVWCQSTAAVVSNCVIAGNAAAGNGGGAYGGILNNCSLADNSAERGGGASASSYFMQNEGPVILNNCTLTGNSAGFGGGAYGGTLNNCTLSGNSADYSGGGAYVGTLNNCTLTENSDGASASTLNNCIVYYNGWNHSDSTLNYCCTTPLPESWQGVGNITNAPLFVDYASGNLRLQSNSPCINAGTNYYVPGSTDLDGRPRIVGARVDIGAYEFQGSGMGEFIAWLQQYGLPTDGSADATDPDGDGLNNWQEWRCLTDPTNALSALRLLTPESDGTNVTVRWTSVAGVTYYVLRSTDLGASLPFRLLASNILGQSGTTSYTDTNMARRSALFYRVGVGNYIAPPSAPPPTLT